MKCFIHGAGTTNKGGLSLSEILQNALGNDLAQIWKRRRMAQIWQFFEF